MLDIRQKAVDENVIGDSLVQRFRPSWRIILFFLIAQVLFEG